MPGAGGVSWGEIVQIRCQGKPKQQSSSDEDGRCQQHGSMHARIGNITERNEELVSQNSHEIRVRSLLLVEFQLNPDGNKNAVGKNDRYKH